MAESGEIEALRELATRSPHETITLINSAADEQHNQAVVLMKLIGELA